MKFKKNKKFSPKVSVIVPVFNNSEQLVKCIYALVNQSYPADLYHIIVVDNGSTEKIKNVLLGFTGVTYILENRPGSYIARNTGIKYASGEIIAFTDSDCIPKYDWLENGIDIFCEIILIFSKSYPCLLPS